MHARSALVAIIDDEAAVRAALLRLLRLKQYRAVAFATAAEFFDKLDEVQPDCIILDVHMPEINGLDVLQRLSKMRKSPPVIVITADDGQRTEQECRLLGSREYLRKPVESELLIDSLERILAESTL